jgi:autotransporter translocation and assembly factor TamB
LVRKPEKMLVEVVFDELIARLPEAESRQLIELNENPSVTILQPIAEPKGQRADDDVPWHFVIHLGNKARIERGTAMDIKVAGDPNVVLAQDLGVTGTIFLKRGGAMVLYRKLFVIETGGVIFDTSDPKDPRLDVQASYRTSDGDTLFVYVTGTLTHPEVKFDRPREQAMAVLLKDDASATNLGIGVLDTLIGDTPLARVQLRTQDGSETGDATTYTAAYRVNERFVVEGNYRAGSGGDNAPGDAVPGASAAVDWRVGRNVSVRGQLGTIGTGVELVYQYEY